MGSIIGALIGRHLEHQEQARDEARDKVLPQLRAYAKDPAAANISRDDADNLLRTALDMHWIDKNYGKILTREFNTAQAKYEAGKKQEQLARDTASTRQQPTNYGVPNMDPSRIAPGLNSAMAPSQQFNFSGPPTAQLPAPPDQNANAVQQEQVKSAILQRLMPAILAAKAQQDGGGAPAETPGEPPRFDQFGRRLSPSRNFVYGGGEGTLDAAVRLDEFGRRVVPAAPPPTPRPVPTQVAQPGMPQPPFTDGTGAGPVPPQGQPASQPAPQQNPAPTLARVGSIAGGTGFGGPSPAPPLVPMPAIVANDLNDTKPHLFPIRGISLADRAQRDAYAKAMGERVSGPAAAQLQREKEDADLAATEARWNKDPDYQKATTPQRLTVKTGKPVAVSPMINISSRSTPAPAGAVDIDGNPVKEGTPGSIREYNGTRFFVPDAGKWTKTSVLQPDGTTKIFTVNSTTNEVFEPGGSKLIGAARARPIKVTHMDGTTTEEMVGPTGQWMSSDPRLAGFNPMMLPTTADHVQLVEQPNGDKAVYIISTSSGKVTGTQTTPVSTPTGVAAPAGTPATSGGGAAAVPAGRPTARIPARPAAKISAPTVVGGRSFTREQRVAEENKANVYDETIKLANSVKSRLNLVSTVLGKAKIKWQTDPSTGFIHGLINENVPMSTDEKKLAGDIISLNEAINSARIPLGAGGFKSKDSYQALRALGLNIQANTGVSSQVLDNTIRLLTGQRDTILKELQGKGVPSPPEQMPSPGAAPPEGETEDQKIERLTKKHG